jgi:Flp pilus assembly protein TadB
MMPFLSRYERWTKSLGNFIKIRLAGKDEKRVRKYLDIAHLDVEPGEVVGLAMLSFLGLFFIGLLISVSLWMFSGEFPLLSGFPILFFFLMIVTGFFLFYYFYSMPSRMATKWKLKASSQMVPAVLYTVIYMKHTSNLERAISFVSQNIEEPLSLDFKKVLWDVETGKYSSLKDSLDAYLEFWRESNTEFIESFHLIESSLYEPSESRRIQILERALQVILDGVYDSMLKYTHSVKSPLTNIYMLGIVLPTLGLALLPLASTLLGGLIQWPHIFVFFNILIPFFVFYLTLQVMLKRPGGYGESNLLERNPLYSKYSSKKPYVTAGLICFPFLILGLLPLLFGYTPVSEWLGLASAGEIYDPPLESLGLGFLGRGNFFGFESTENGLRGPFGVAALILSLLVPFSIAMFFSLSLSMRTKELIKSRNETKALEKEFTSSLFTLGNRLGDGVPAEIAFSKVAESTKGQRTEEFFKIVNSNLQSMGMGLEDALFNPRRGALIYYPSSLIATSMRILIESVKKGLKVAAQSLMSISEYVRNIQKINERLHDLLADIVSDMKSNMTFLAPLLAGIVVGLASMITGILSQLKVMLESGGSAELAGLGNISNMLNLFDFVNMIPPYFLQIAIGIYIIQIVFILTGTLVTIDSGEDKLKRAYDISKNLIRGTILYLVIAFISIIVLSTIASVALGGIVV